LVLQCPPDNRAWTFRPQKDGNLDVLSAATDHIINNNPIDEKRLSVFGLSSGGQGAWQWLMKESNRLAAAVPASCGAPNNLQEPASLSQTPIWTFRNKNDRSAGVESIQQAMQIINESGGYMKLTEFDQGGHAAWRPAMDEENCFAWLIAQKRGGWFNPPPERKVYQGRSLKNSFFAFFLPLGFMAGLLVFQRSSYCTSHVTDYEEKVNETEPPSADTLRIWTDVTGTKKVHAKEVGFQCDDLVRIQSPQGKIATAKINQFCEADQALMLRIRGQMSGVADFRKWTDNTGKHSFIAKFIGFQSDGKILLQSPKGQTLVIPVSQLGQVEQKFLVKQQEQSINKSLHDDFREWNNYSGTRKIVAKLLGFQDDKAHFELQDGRKIATPIHQFSAEDQILLAQLKSGKQSIT
jgi:hypothetical protein